MSTSAAASSVPDNRLFIGDCLPVLADLADKHGECVDLVYMDPPFNSQRLYNHAFRGKRRTMPQKVAFHDSWKWTEATRKDFREFAEKEAPGTPAARFLGAMRDLLEKRDESTLAYVTYMTRRLARVRAVMKPTASVYLHCDPTASHYLKLAMDAVFGRGNFRNDIVWKRYRGKRSGTTKKFPAVVDNILFYSGGGTFNLPFFPLRSEYVDRVYIHDDGDGQGPYRFGGRIRGRKYYLRNSRGIPATSLWDDIPELNGTDAEMLGHETQKPVALLKRVIAASSGEGDLVLDPFCGCGTTIAACHETGRRFIGVDVARSAAQVISRRMSRHYPDFGKLVIGDKTPTNVRGWGRLLRDDDAESPAWARFQYAAIDAIPKAEQIEGAIQRSARRGADGGVDGLLHLRRPQTGAMDSVVIQVKRKKQPSVADVADTIAAAANNNAFMGLLITLNPPTAEMRRRATAKMNRFNGKHYPRVAILTYEEVLAGKYREALPYEFAVDLQSGSQAALELPRNAAKKGGRKRG